MAGDFASPETGGASGAGLRLYHYWRSSSSWRVRWALIHKGISCAFVPINLLSDEAESPAHRARNPLGSVPVLEIPRAGGAAFLGESVAILEWLEETHPASPLLPRDPLARARVRQLVEIINSETQPFQNPPVTARVSDDPEAQKRWSREWILRGLGAFAQVAAGSAGRFCVGDEPTWADLCLIPQCYAAGRVDAEWRDFPLIARVHEAAERLPSYRASHPDRFAPAP